MPVSMLTTEDNPYDPWVDWDSWYAFDKVHGYNTPSLLARVAITSHDLSDGDTSQAIEDAIDEIVTENVLGIYKKITRDHE